MGVCADLVGGQGLGLQGKGKGARRRLEALSSTRPGFELKNQTLQGPEYILIN